MPRNSGSSEGQEVSGRVGSTAGPSSDSRVRRPSLQNLDQWTMRQSLLELQLMIKQTASNVRAEVPGGGRGGSRGLGIHLG